MAILIIQLEEANGKNFSFCSLVVEDLGSVLEISMKFSIRLKSKVSGPLAQAEWPVSDNSSTTHHIWMWN